MLLLALLVGTACGSSPTAADPLAGTYDVKGGGAPKDVFDALSAEFRKQHPTVRFSFDDVGSSAGMKLASTGDVDLATSSAVPSSDIAATVKVVPVGSSGTAVIVNAANPVAGLTKTQVRDVFAGAITEWSAVGGDHIKIITVIRESTSALRSNFDAYFFGGKGTYRTDALELNTGDEIVRAAAGQTGVISMVTITAAIRADARIRPLAIDGVAPTKENILSGAYKVVRPLYLVYNPSHVKPAIAAFLDFVRSPDGQRVIDLVSTGG